MARESLLRTRRRCSGSSRSSTRTSYRAEVGISCYGAFLMILQSIRWVGIGPVDFSKDSPLAQSNSLRDDTSFAMI